MAWVDGRDLDFATLRQQHLGASVPVAWLESMKPRAFFTPPALPANRKASSATSAVMRWRWQPRWTPFLAARRAAYSLRIGYRLGRRPLLYRLRAAAGRHGDYCLRRTADVPGLRGLVENCREIPVNRMFSAPTAIRVLKNSRRRKSAITISPRWRRFIWPVSRWTSRRPVG